MSDNGSSEVTIIDYGMGNLFSVKQACEHVGLTAKITSDKKDVAQAPVVILPGVGAFGDAMNNLRKLDLLGVISDFITSGRPFMGICLGMQLLMSESEEFGPHKGIGLFGGKAVKFPLRHSKGYPIKVPQVGWNRVYGASQKSWDGSPLEGLTGGEYMYFVHSFYVVPEKREIMLSKTRYEDVEYCSALQDGNVFACQFHPEKSGPNGIALYRNFARMVHGIKSAA